MLSGIRRVRGQDSHHHASGIGMMYDSTWPIGEAFLAVRAGFLLGERRPLIFKGKSGAQCLPGLLTS